jgi:tetratricopeptide (TPR) repeat protein
MSDSYEDVPAVESAGDDRIAQREFIMLGALFVAALLLFFVTRTMAVAARGVRAETAAEWYAIGQQRIANGTPNLAVSAFRKATVNAPRDRTYALALAQALSTSGDTNGAEAVLNRVRDTAPEDAEVNLQLARIAAARHDVTASARLYRNALYGQWAADATASPRRIRIELARMLIDNAQATAAASELMIAAIDVTDPGDQTSIGTLLVAAHEYQRAADLFRRALVADPGRVDALVGAGEAAFHLGAYANAVRYFQRATNRAPLTGVAAADAEVSRLILTLDPLGPRLAASERARRLVVLLGLIELRLAGCAQGADLARDLGTFEHDIRGDALRRDPDLMEHGIALLERCEREAAMCGAQDATAAAIRRIAAAHPSEGH